ncbi:MAG: ATP-binding protein [Pseudomonadota bacterium]
MPESGVFEQVESRDRLRITFSTCMANVDRACDAAMEYLETRVPRIRPHLFAINLSMREGLTNAVRHGNRNDPEKLIILSLFMETRDVMCVSIQDQGDGFLWKEAPTGLPDDDADHGRGLAIIHAYCSEYRFNDAGNILTLKKKLTPLI